MTSDNHNAARMDASPVSLAAADAAARERAVDPARSFIVQAPAGSGKTELLTQRYLRLLATVEQPEEVLAITFTRKAAAEMRNRILESLAAAADEEPADQAHKRRTWQLARAVRELDAQRGWNLMLHPARLRIQTIDALSGQLARRLPVLSGAGAALEPVRDPMPLYEEACQRLIEGLGDGSSVSQKMEVLIAHLANRVDRLSGMLTSLLSKRDQWLHHVMAARSSRDLRGAVEGALRTVVEVHLQELCRHVPPALCDELWELTQYACAHLLERGSVNGVRRALFESSLQRIEAPGAKCEHLDAWRAIAEVFTKDDGKLYRKLNRVQGFPAAEADVAARAKAMLAVLTGEPEMGRLLAELRTLPTPAYDDDQWTVLEALLTVLPAAVVQLQDVFQARGEADYVECALRALTALGTTDEPTDLALAFDYRLRHILIDEFQDTSFTQLDLLERLTAGWMPGDGRTLFCVGDPMQSIYRFRQAEVGLFLELQQRGLGSIALEPLKLSANFRSGQALVHWVNGAFPQVLAERNDAEHGAVMFSPSMAARAQAEEQSAAAVHVHAQVGTTPYAESRKVVELTRAALDRDATGTVAILVAGRLHLGSIASELARAGIEFQAVEIERLADRPVVQDLIALTRSLVHLADRPAWLAILRAPWCGLRLADLHAIAADRPERTVAQLLEDENLSQRLSPDGRQRLARAWPVLQAALQERARYPLREWVERAWNALGGPATLATAQDLDDAEAYFCRLDELDRSGDLQDVARLEEELEDLFARPRPGTAGRVEVMTIHKAKGLEFDTVILPGLDRVLRGEDRALLRWTRLLPRPQGGAGPEWGHPPAQSGLILAPVTAEGADHDRVYRWLEVLEAKRTEFERGRLLYVAVTRAKRELHLLGRVKARLTPVGPELVKPTTGSMLRMLWQAVASQFEDAVQAAVSVDTFAQPPPAPSLLLRRLPLEWQPPAADARFEHAQPQLPAAGDAERPEFDWVSETSRHVGTLVHRELDRMTRGGRLTHGAHALRSHRPRLLAELAELGVPPERCGNARERVLSAIERTLGDAQGRWLLGLEEGTDEVESELALSGVIDGRVRNGVIDRTFLDAEGTRWIVDFKTSTHEGGGLEAFLAAEVERYRTQLLRYAQLMRMYRPQHPVRAALYFPLLGTLREVSL